MSGEWNDPRNIGPKTVDLTKLPARKPRKPRAYTVAFDLTFPGSWVLRVNGDERGRFAFRRDALAALRRDHDARL